jgi:amino acid adenylation domain-containing protein
MTLISKLLKDLYSLDVKIWVDNNTIRYDAPKETLTPTLLNQIREHKAEIIECLQSPHLPSILPVDRNQPLPLSFAQQRLWLLEQLNPDTSTYCIATAYHLTGLLDVTALEKSLCELIQRHEILRTTFSEMNGLPTQVISKETALTLPLINLEKLSPNQQKSETQRQADQEGKRSFDLAQGPLLRTKLLRLNEQEHVLLLNMHHIISDGWSFDVSFRELTALYQAFASSKPSPLPKLPIQYADFSCWQREWVQNKVFQSQLDYWKKQLSQGISVLQLPTDRPRPLIKTYQGSYQSIEISKELTKKLKVLSQQEGVTLFMTLLAAFQTLLLRYSAQAEIVVGSPIAGRNQPETNELIGFFVNTLVLRTDLSGNPSFRELLLRVREVALGAYAHQDLPFEQLLEELQPERDLSRTPLFDVMFVLQKASPQVLEIPGLALIPLEVDNGTAKFDLTLDLQEIAEGMKGRLEYSTDLFDADTISRMIDNLQTLLVGIIANPAQCLSDLPILSPAEQHRLLVEWNSFQPNALSNICIHHLFEAQVEKTPDDIAIVYNNQQFTYQQLNHSVNQLAHYLQQLGIQPEVLVGICLERSIELIVALLAILKAGGAYVPLDPNYPPERIAFMLEDSKALVLITQQSLVEKLPVSKTRVICLDTDEKVITRQSVEIPTCTATANNLAYILYTSGSTGQPKGVAVEHHSTVNFLNWARAIYNSEQLSGVLASTSINFDLSVFEIFAPLCWGGRVIMAENALHLPTLPTTENVTLLNTVPSAITELLKMNAIPSGVRTFNFCGEPLSLKIVQKLYQNHPERQIFNLYGPTEATTYATFTLVQPNESKSPTIGRPLFNTQIYILDRHLQLVPIGVPGELHIGGEGLARGYLNHPELTKEKFIPNLFDNSNFNRLYKTGDLVRYLPDGNIEFLGRIDNQVKIRGFRIELGEIEAILFQHPFVEQTVVIVREDTSGDKRLVAYLAIDYSYLIQNPKSKIQNQLRAFLKQKLPDHMIPTAWILLDTLPLTPNGKIDRKALLATQWTNTSQKKITTYPQTLTEEMLAQIWAEALGFKVLNRGKSQINIYDNFFELGGYSLVAALVISRIRDVFQVEMPLSLFFEFPTIAGLAEKIETEQQTDRLHSQTELQTYSSLVAIRSGGSKRPFFLIPGGRGGERELIHFAKLVYLLGHQQPVYGFRARGWDEIHNPHTTVESMATDYIKEIHSVQPEGPYLLGGECLGGFVAVEIAQQLIAKGQEVRLLVFLDTAIPTWPREIYYHVDKIFRITIIRHYLRNLLLLSKREWPTYISNLAIRVRQKLQEDRGVYHPSRIGTNYINIIRRYKPQTYCGRITWLATKSIAREVQNNQLNHFATGDLKIHQLPGDHESYLGRNVEITAEKLKACIDEAQGDDT